MFTGVSKVCWDINETFEGGRKWTQVLFVSAADAHRYRAGTVTYPDIGVARGTGGFDLGFTAPDFRDPDGPTDRIHPQGGTLAGVKLLLNAPSWFQNQDNWTTRNEGPGNIITDVTDKAARYTHCLENQPNNMVRLTQATPSGPRTFDMSGRSPRPRSGWCSKTTTTTGRRASTRRAQIRGIGTTSRCSARGPAEQRSGAARLGEIVGRLWAPR